MLNESNEFLCVRCARHQETCCQTSEVFVTLGDVQRIEAFTGISGFAEFRAPDNQTYADQDDDPVWRDFVFRSDGTRRVIKRRSAGDCTFLGEAGCVLPYDVRPLVCRLYPFSYTENGIQEELSPGCPLELLLPNQSLLGALEMNVERARDWQRQLYSEIKLEAGEVTVC